jgi:HSP20 family protein
MNTEIVETKNPEVVASAPQNSENAETPEAEVQAVDVVPPVDVVDQGDAVLLVADLPGVPAEAAEVTVHEGVLALSALQKAPPAGAPFERKRYVRRFAVADTLDPDGIEAKLQDGVLTLRIPKVPKAAPRTIAVAG